MSIINLLGIASAYAADPATSSSQGMMSSLPIFVILIVAMYFLVIRPQTKRAKEHRTLMSSLKTGDEVITSGGILGRIVKIVDNFIVVAIADNIEIKVQKASVMVIVPKGTSKSIDE